MLREAIEKRTSRVKIIQWIDDFDDTFGGIIEGEKSNEKSNISGPIVVAK